MRARMSALILTTWLMSSGFVGGCSPAAPERRTVWATNGTPGRITDDRPIQHLVKVGDELQPSKGIMRGMVAIDEPTYLLLLKTYQESKAKTGD